MKLFSRQTLMHSKKILQIVLPSGLNSFLDILNISIALLFVGKLSTSHIVAFGVGMNFVMLFYTITAIFFTGTNAIISRLYRDIPQRQIALSTLTLYSFFASLPICTFAFLIDRIYLQWMGGSEQALSLAQTYLEVLIFGFPALMVKTTLTSAFSAISKAKIPFFIKVFCTLFNISANYILIFGALGIPALDMVGAGLANVLSITLEALILLWMANRSFGLCKTIHFQYFKFALKIGIPTGAERALTLFSLVLIAKFLLSYGDEILAGFQIGGRIEAFAFMPGFGFMIASMTLMGQNIKHLKIAKHYIYLIILISSIFMGILGVGMCVFGKHLSIIFSSDCDVIGYSSAYLIAVGISQIPLIMIFVLDGALRGAGATKVSLFINASSIWGLRILPMYLCTLFSLSYVYIFGIICIETFIRAFIFWRVFSQEQWKKNIVKI